MINFKKSLIACAMMAVTSGAAYAAVSPQEAKQLGDTLTLVGAEKAANGDNSIPAYNGGLDALPAGFKPGDTKRPNPFADEKPVLVITKANMAEHADLLTDTAKALLERFDSYKINVYPTHRTVSLPEKNLQNTLKNAVGAKSIDGGLGLENALPGVPFPIPKTGYEAMWNHLLRYQGKSLEGKFDNWNVDSAGTATLATTGQGYIGFPIYENMDQMIKPDDIYYRIKLQYSGPARRAGEAILLQDAANPIVQPRRAWQYLPGQRRVKLAPDLGYDTPNPGAAGASTYDDAFVFMGGMDRFDFELVGKKEMYVPYNAYDVTYNPNMDSLLTPNHLNPASVRWEKHRVWVVKASLKEGKRHIYKDRIFYLDEDSWIALASDQYDARDQLYRGSFAFLSPSYDVATPDATTHMVYDLIGGNYAVSGLFGQHFGIKYDVELSAAEWSPNSLAGRGIR